MIFTIISIIILDSHADRVVQLCARFKLDQQILPQASSIYYIHQARVTLYMSLINMCKRQHSKYSHTALQTFICGDPDVRARCYSTSVLMSRFPDPYFTSRTWIIIWLVNNYLQHHNQTCFQVESCSVRVVNIQSVTRELSLWQLNEAVCGWVGYEIRSCHTEMSSCPFSLPLQPQCFQPWIHHTANTQTGFDVWTSLNRLRDAVQTTNTSSVCCQTAPQPQTHTHTGFQRASSACRHTTSQGSNRLSGFSSGHKRRVRGRQSTSQIQTGNVFMTYRTFININWILIN